MAEKSMELVVEGMSCNHCATSVRKALEQLNGVASAEVDLPGKKVRVNHDPGLVSRQSIEKAIEGRGYRVS